LGEPGLEPMTRARTICLTTLAMLAFAGNSLLCRQALKNTPIDAASFTSIRLIAAAITLWLLLRLMGRGNSRLGSWPSAFALFAYAAGFSFAYISLSAASGALLLFGSVQTTMIGYGMSEGERLRLPQVAGLALALGGLVGLVFPGLSAPPLTSSLFMMGAGIAWGIYSLRGRGAGDPTMVTAGNFLRTIPLTLLFSLLMFSHQNIDRTGLLYAVASGAMTSGVGYAIWYMALPGLKATQAATVQLSVPVIAALGGIVLLAEPITSRLILASVAILSGIALVVYEKNKVIISRNA
jgi:drug/metabolite transporter (DMT)-like permease